MEKTIKIFDTTLRDGEQSPGCSMNLQEKIEVAKMLELLNVDIIEAGFAIASPGDAAAIKTIANHIKDSTICSLARCAEKDIDAAWDAVRQANSSRIHVFLATSPLHMQYKLQMTPDQVLASIAHNVAYARKFCPDIEFSAEDACRTDLDFLCQAFDTAIRAGATTLNIPDTVGYLLPDEYAHRVAYVKTHTPNVDNVVLSCHCHNDLGMGVANSLAGVMAGIGQIECTINGIGERAGNASMEECVMAMQVRQPYIGATCRIDTQQIYRASRLIQTITGVPVSPTKPIVGANAFAHESGIHQHGVLAHKETYEIMTPETIGIPTNSIVLGKHSGRHAFENRLEDLGYKLDKADIDTAFIKFKELADKKKTIKDRDLEAIIGVLPTDIEELYSLKRFVINSGNTITSTAVITVNKGAEILEEAAASDGPINASYRAINQIVKQHIILIDYHLNALTDGEDAQCEAIVKIRFDNDSPIITGRGISTDIVEASIKAYINGINKHYSAN